MNIRYRPLAVLLPACLLVPTNGNDPDGGAADTTTDTTDPSLAVTESTDVSGGGSCETGERIFAADTSTMAYLMDLGVVPVASAAYEAGFHGPDAPVDGRFPPAFAELGSVDDVVPIDRFEPNIEQIAALEPTLVIGTSTIFTYVPQFETVSDGVRVERYDEDDQDPAQNLLSVAEIVGCAEVGQALVDELDGRIDALTIDAPDGLTVDVTRWFEAGFDIFLDGFLVQQLGEFGASVPLADTLEPDDDDIRMREVSFERMDLLTADVLIRLVVPGGEFDETILTTVADHPLYPLIPAVDNDRVIDVDTFAGQGYAGMTALAAELERLVGELQAQTA